MPCCFLLIIMCVQFPGLERLSGSDTVCVSLQNKVSRPAKRPVNLWIKGEFIVGINSAAEFAQLAGKVYSCGSAGLVSSLMGPSYNHDG
jgi:hypothetical protein